jgi:acetyl esterase/lipase
MVRFRLCLSLFIYCRRTQSASFPRLRSEMHLRLPLRVRLLSWSLLLLIMGMLSSCVGYIPTHSGEKVRRNIVFARTPQRDLKLDLYVPETTDNKPPPVVIWMYGGSWKFGWKDIHVVLRDLSRHGLAVASIQYRFSKEAPFPAQLHDARAAVAWLQQNGSRYGVDGTRIGVSGESAGAHIASLLGVLDGPPDVRAVCALSPPADLVALYEKHAWTGNQTIANLIRARLPEHNDMAREASPTFLVRDGAAPFLILHGKLDPIVPVQQSEELHAALRKHGVECTLKILPHKAHWFSINQAQVAEVAEFFRRHLD